MQPHVKLSRVALIFAGVLFTVFCIVEKHQVAMATSTGAVGSVPSDVLQAIDAVHTAAQQADMTTSLKAKQAVHDVPPVASEDWGLDGGRLLVIGVGVAVGVVAVNFITGGTVTTPALAAAVGSVGTRTATAGVAAGGSLMGIYGLTGAVVGGLTGNYLYSAMQADAPVEKPEL